jgi:hypothetical protein
MAANQVAAGAVRRTVHDTFLDTQSGYVDEQGGLVEMKANDVLRTPSTPHGSKYSLVYILKGTGWSGTTTMSTKAIIGIFVSPRLLKSLRPLTA